MEIDVSYTGKGEWKSAGLIDKTMFNLTELKMTRRHFMPNAFYVDISTPNDANTGGVAGAAVITDYDLYRPTLTITDGGCYREQARNGPFQNNKKSRCNGAYISEQP